MIATLLLAMTVITSTPNTKTFVINGQETKMRVVAEKENYSVPHILASYQVAETPDEVGAFVRYALPRGDLNLEILDLKWNEVGQLVFFALIDGEEVSGNLKLVDGIFTIEISDPDGSNTDTFDFGVWTPVDADDLRPAYIEYQTGPDVIPRCKCGIVGEPNNNNGTCTTEQCDDIATCTDPTSGHTGSCGYAQLVL